MLWEFFFFFSLYRRCETLIVIRSDKYNHQVSFQLLCESEIIQRCTIVKFPLLLTHENKTIKVYLVSTTVQQPILGNIAVTISRRSTFRSYKPNGFSISHAKLATSVLISPAGYVERESDLRAIADFPREIAYRAETAHVTKGRRGASTLSAR